MKYVILFLEAAIRLSNIYLAGGLRVHRLANELSLRKDNDIELMEVFLVVSIFVNPL